ncbi:MAG: hypothetical protein ACR2JH_08095, partial [Solirubrobacteraceae bacterium]
ASFANRQKCCARCRWERAARAPLRPRPPRRRRCPESLAPALIAEIDSFWHSGPALSDLHVNPFAVEATDALLRQLGPAPVDVGGENLVALLTPVYRALAEQAERRALE